MASYNCTHVAWMWTRRIIVHISNDCMIIRLYTHRIIGHLDMSVSERRMICLNYPSIGATTQQKDVVTKIEVSILIMSILLLNTDLQ